MCVCTVTCTSLCKCDENSACWSQVPTRASHFYVKITRPIYQALTQLRNCRSCHSHTDGFLSQSYATTNKNFASMSNLPQEKIRVGSSRHLMHSWCRNRNHKQGAEKLDRIQTAPCVTRGRKRQSHLCLNDLTLLQQCCFARSWKRIHVIMAAE